MSFDYIFKVTFCIELIDWHQKLSFETNYNDFWLFWSAQASRMFSKINLWWVLWGTFWPLRYLWKIIVHFNNLKCKFMMFLNRFYQNNDQWYVNKTPRTFINCRIYYSLPLFNWFLTTFLILGHFKIVTYHCNWSQMKAFDVPQWIL